MQARELRDLIADVKTGRLTRRAFVERMIAVGLTAPIAGVMLNGGVLKLLYWQAVTLLNPHFAIGTKDQEGSRIFYEPLAGWDSEGNLALVLAAEIPSKKNDGVDEDGRSVVWKLKRAVKWHDGKPFTADDVVFTWEYARTPETSAVTIASYGVAVWVLIVLACVLLLTAEINDRSVRRGYKRCFTRSAKISRGDDLGPTAYRGT